MEKKKSAVPAPAAAAAAKIPVLSRSRIRLHPVQERLLLEGVTPANTRVAVWLNRRLALHIFSGLRLQIEKSSPAGKQPAAWREESLALEHAAILKSDQGKAAPKPWPADAKARLATGLTIKQIGEHTQIALFSGKQPVAVLVAAGPALHRLAAMLAFRIQQARWEEGLDLAWLAKPQEQQRLPGPKKAN